MSRKQLCCSQKQKIRKLKKRQRKKKISTEFPQLKHSKKQKYYEDTKKGEQEKNETPSTMLSWSEKKKKDICFWNFVQLENLYKALSTSRHFVIPYYITWILNCLLEAKRISRHFIHAMYYIHHISYHYFYIPYFA